MKDLKTIESRVRVILSNHKEARDDDMILYLLYCNRYGEVKIGELPFEMVMNNYKVFHIPCFESIRRTRQKIQAVTPELGCSPKVRRARKSSKAISKPMLPTRKSEVIPMNTVKRKRIRRQNNERNIYPSAENESFA